MDGEIVKTGIILSFSFCLSFQCVYGGGWDGGWGQPSVISLKALAGPTVLAVVATWVWILFGYLICLPLLSPSF